MAATQINLDDSALEAASRILGTTTKVDTVNSALRAVVRQEQQRRMILRSAADGTYANTPRGDEAWQ